MRRLLLLLLLVVLVALAGIGDLSAAKPGLICGTPDDPIPCSTYNNGQCSHSYNRDTNCCVASGPCVNRCC